jgi:hypothetical protein
MISLSHNLRALVSIGMTTDKYATMLFPMVESCIPEELLRVWLRIPAVATVVEPQNNAYSDKLKQLLSFLRNEVEGEERISLAKAEFKLTEGSVWKDKKKPSTEGSVATASDLFSGERNVGKQLGCIFCEKPHESRECFQAPKLPLSDKQEVLKRKKCCFTCLKTGHRSKECKGVWFVLRSTGQ